MKHRASTVGLVMIVKDEAATIRALLEKARPLINTWTVCDTGSTDGTQQIIIDTLAGIPGTLHERPWVNFAHNRTEALELAKGSADYHLMLDGDHTIETSGERPNRLTADAYLIRVHSAGDDWRLALLTRDGHPFEYRGAAHSYLHSDAPTKLETLDWLTVHGGAGASREKLERDRTALTQAFAENPGDARTVFYLAQTHRDLGDTGQAIVYYQLRANMNGWDEERYWARYQLGILLGETVGFHKGATELLAAWAQRPTRAESLRALGNLCHSVADKIPPPADDRLFVRRSAYNEAANA